MPTVGTTSDSSLFLCNLTTSREKMTVKAEDVKATLLAAGISRRKILKRVQTTTIKPVYVSSRTAFPTPPGTSLSPPELRLKEKPFRCLPIPSRTCSFKGEGGKDN